MKYTLKKDKQDSRTKLRELFGFNYLKNIYESRKQKRVKRKT